MKHITTLLNSGRITAASMLVFALSSLVRARWRGEIASPERHAAGDQEE
jgi:hypothetical protein